MSRISNINECIDNNDNNNNGEIPTTDDNDKDKDDCYLQDNFADMQQNEANININVEIMNNNDDNNDNNSTDSNHAMIRIAETSAAATTTNATSDSTNNYSFPSVTNAVGVNRTTNNNNNNNGNDDNNAISDYSQLLNALLRLRNLLQFNARLYEQRVDISNNNIQEIKLVDETIKISNIVQNLTVYLSHQPGINDWKLHPVPTDYIPLEGPLLPTFTPNSPYYKIYHLYTGNECDNHNVERQLLTLNYDDMLHRWERKQWMENSANMRGRKFCECGNLIPYLGPSSSWKPPSVQQRALMDSVIVTPALFQALIIMSELDGDSEAAADQFVKALANQNQVHNIAGMYNVNGPLYLMGYLCHIKNIKQCVVFDRTSPISTPATSYNNDTSPQYEEKTDTTIFHIVAHEDEVHAHTYARSVPEQLHYSEYMQFIAEKKTDVNALCCICRSPILSIEATKDAALSTEIILLYISSTIIVGIGQPCNHIFHTHCLKDNYIQASTTNNQQCPLCRTEYIAPFTWKQSQAFYSQSSRTTAPNSTAMIYKFKSGVQYQQSAMQMLQTKQFISNDIVGYDTSFIVSVEYDQPPNDYNDEDEDEKKSDIGSNNFWIHNSTNYNGSPDTVSTYDRNNVVNNNNNNNNNNDNNIINNDNNGNNYDDQPAELSIIANGAITRIN